MEALTQTEGGAGLAGDVIFESAVQLLCPLQETNEVAGHQADYSRPAAQPHAIDHMV
jgi:hypothetical protein